jgi:hypothetical protein
VKILDILSWFQPKQIEESIRDINYDNLKSLGYKTILFDYDNTIAVWKSEFDRINRPIIDKLFSDGFKVAVVSNSPMERISNTKAYFGDRLKLFHSLKKPGVKALRSVLIQIESVPEETVIIGDLFFTDIVAGNRLGMHTILVKPPYKEDLSPSQRLIGGGTIFMYKAYFYSVGWVPRILDLATPHYFVDSVENIDFLGLKKAGIKIMVFDFDNTLEKYHSFELSENSKLILKMVKSLNMIPIIISNGKKERIKRATKELKNIFVVAEAKKPFTSKLKKILKHFKVNPYEIAVVGDQLFTDIIMGNMLGTLTIKVKPISENEFFWTKFVRILEKRAMKYLRKKPILEGVNIEVQRVRASTSDREP